MSSADAFSELPIFSGSTRKNPEDDVSILLSRNSPGTNRHQWQNFHDCGRLA
ncbi:MAG TPA: hypothetical protein PKA76_12840 [Pirellulaceae bacterium]|nr:hypothetical protein [Pirellulaceae bacterium]HMP70233.1 hypothetical protein [Pirellulaceae bacterium]